MFVDVSSSSLCNNVLKKQTQLLCLYPFLLLHASEILVKNQASELIISGGSPK
jgi:hypothetical protein